MRVKPTGVGANRVCWLAELCDANTASMFEVMTTILLIFGDWQMFTVLGSSLGWMSVRFGLFHCLALKLTVLRCFETSVATRLHSITSMKTWISVSITFYISPVFNFLEMRLVVAEMCWKYSVWETVELFKCRWIKNLTIMPYTVLRFVIGITR
jgi:hypothetical protein